MCREQCAAVMQTHSAGYFAAAVRQLPPAARITLCNVLQVPTQPVSIRIQSDRITQVVSAALCGAAATQAGGGPGAAAAPVAAGVQGQALLPAAWEGFGAAGPAAAAAALGRCGAATSGGGRRIGSRWGELLSAEQSRRGAGATACRCRGSGGGRSDGAVAAACGGSGDISPGFRRGSGGGCSGVDSEACRAEGPERPPVGSGGSAAGGGSY